MSTKTAKIVNRILTYGFLIILSVIIIYPLLVTSQSAFQARNIAAFSLDFNAEWGLDNFRRLFNDTNYLYWYKNTIVIALIVMVVQVTVVTLAGYVFSRYRFVGRKKSLVFFLVIQMVPTTAALTAYFVLANILGAIDQYWLLALIYIGGGIPMNVWLMKGYFDTIPRDFDESARIDGAGHLRIFAQINLPLVRPMLAVQALWAFMGPFNDYLLSRLLLRTNQVLTLAPGLQTLISNPREQKVALFAAGAVLAALPIVVLFFFLQKNFVSGLTSGGSKG